MAINGENGVSAVTVDELLKQGLGYQTINAHTVGMYRLLYNWWMISAKLFEIPNEKIFPMFWVQSFFTMMVSISM